MSNETDTITRSKWKEAYQRSSEVRYDPRDIHPATLVSRNYIQKYMSPSDKLFLEAGCGTARSSLDTALTHNVTVVCLDIITEALLIAKRLFKENNASGCFIRADMRLLPFTDETFDFIFSDGVVEHIRETSLAISEFFRVLKKGGRLLLTVPQISISMLTLGQLRGNIPNIPLLRRILIFIQMQVLNRRFMKNGYEQSFTLSQLKRLLNIFSFVEVGLYETFHELKWLKIAALQKSIQSLMKHKLFCPLIYGFGVKIENENRPNQHS
jgi:ubiquinone/menaquinone biosynthesis C-methylase UbiE